MLEVNEGELSTHADVLIGKSAWRGADQINRADFRTQTTDVGCCGEGGGREGRLYPQCNLVLTETVMR